MEKTYRDHKITLDETHGQFLTTINGLYHRYSSLKQAMNAIDKSAVVDFKPTDVLIVNSSGYDPATYSIKRITLTGYEEEKGYRGGLNRYYTVKGGQRINVDGRYETIYDVKDLAILEENVKEANVLERVQAKAEKRGRTLDSYRERLAINLDPRPELRKA